MSDGIDGTGATDRFDRSPGSGGVEVHPIVIQDEAGLEPWAEAWDELAESASRPFCAPSWMLAWWHREAPSGARLRAIVAVDEHAGLVGIAPFFAGPIRRTVTEYRLLASRRGTPNEPLARPGRETQVASLIARQLSEADPRPDVVAIGGATPGWAEAVRRAWPGRPWSLHRDHTTFAPVMDLSGRTFEEWFSGKSRNFQQHMRASERKLQRSGFSAFTAGSREEVERGVAALTEYHVRRWRKRGGSRVWRPGTASMLLEADERLRSTGRFRLVMIDDGDHVISSHLFVAAGTHLSYWLGSFDEDWAKYQPGMVALVAGLRDAWRQGYQSVDFGQGLHPYKLRFADDRRELEWVRLIGPGLAGFRARMHLAPRHGARALARRMPDGVRKLLRDRLRTSWRP